MKINFLLPCEGKNPIGGFKVVYEYANGLVNRGHIVNLIHPVRLKHSSLYKRVRSYGKYIVRKIDKNYSPQNWFKLDPKVNVLLVPSLDEKYISNADFLFATAWDTAVISSNYNDKKGKKYYLIQNYEIWSGSKHEILNTFKLPFKKIVISNWLEKLVNSCNEKAIYIPNGFDFKAFGVDKLPEYRNKYMLMMLYHELWFKGSNYGLKALYRLKNIEPQINVVLFGTYPPPANIPEWLFYYREPHQCTLRKLYNEAAIFISPSFLEGFPLPPAEALISGSSLVVSDIGGHREYAIPFKTAVLFPPGNINKLIDAVLMLINNDDLRIKIAYEGINYMQQFTWSKAVNRLAEILENDIN